MSWSPVIYRGDLITLRPPLDSDVDDFLVKAGQPETTLAYGGDPAKLTTFVPGGVEPIPRLH